MAETPAARTGVLADRVVLVTGASRGLGRAVALAAAASGARVIATARTRGALEALDDDAREAGSPLTLLPLDLKQGDQIDRLGPSIFQRFGRLDVFCHCAAELGLLTRITDIAPERLEQIFATNVFAAQRLLRTLDPLFRPSPSPVVIALTDRTADEGRANWGPYAASKAAMERLFKAYGAENAFRGLKLHLVEPGPMATRLRAEAFPGEDPQTQPQPETVVPRLVALMTEPPATNLDR